MSARCFGTSLNICSSCLGMPFLSWEIACLTTAMLWGHCLHVLLVPDHFGVDLGVRLRPIAPRCLGCGNNQLCAVALGPLRWAVPLSLAQQLLCRFHVGLARKARSTSLLSVGMLAPECDMSRCGPCSVGWGSQQRKY